MITRKSSRLLAKAHRGNEGEIGSVNGKKVRKKNNLVSPKDSENKSNLLDEFENDENHEEIAKNAVIENYFNRGKLKSNRRKKSSSSPILNTDNQQEQETKNRTDKLQCDFDDLKNCFKKIDNYLPEKLKDELNKIEKEFPNWFAYLAAGFNLLIYGIGSKYDLIKRFCETKLGDYTYLIVDAYFPSIDAKTILQALETHLRLKHFSRKKILEWAEELSYAISKQDRDVVIVINNIDGPGMRTSIDQQVLTLLAKCSNVRLLGTMDHLNSTIMWNQKCFDAFNFLWINVNTMLAYSKEVAAGESKLLGLGGKQKSYKHTKTSLDVVWTSLTSNSQMIMTKIAKIYYITKKPIEFFDLFRLARDDFLVSSVIALRQHLTEFVDHHLIRKKHQTDGNEYISVLVDEQMISEFLTEKGISLADDDS